MKKLILLFIFISIGISTKAQNIKIMLVTGGHAYDTVQFLALFDELSGVEYKHFEQPKANEIIGKGETDDFDVMVFYDMWENISLQEKEGYLTLTQKGKPLLFMHHSIVSYQNWPEFEKIVGGKYISKGDGIPVNKESTYEHDIWVFGEILSNHPITSGITELRLFDEVYGNVRISDAVTPLIKTNHPKSLPFLAWENKYNASKIIYLQSGHDSSAFEDADYQKLVAQTIHYLAKSN